MAICKGFLFVFPVNSDLLSSSALKAAPCWGFGTSELHAVRRLASFLGSEGQGGGGDVTGVVAERANTFECRAC